MKAKGLKIIDHLGTNYATFDGSRIWKLEKPIFNLLMECDGKKTVNQLCEKLAKSVNVTTEEIKIGLKPILDELERNGMIVYV